MAAPSDPPQEPDAGAVVDPAVLAQRRARREDPSAHAEVERLRAEQQLAERRAAELEAEVDLLAGELDRRAAEQAAVAAQVTRMRATLNALRERAEAEQAEQAATAELLVALRAGQERVGEALAELRVEHERVVAELTDERARRNVLEARLAAERELATFALARADAAARGERALVGRRLLAVQREVAALEEEVDVAGAAFERRHADERARHRADRSAREQRDAVVERLVGELAGTVAWLRARFQAGLEALEQEPGAVRAPPAAAAVAEPGEPERLGAATLPAAADDRPLSETRVPSSPPAIVHDRPLPGTRVPSADHPALAQAAPPAGAAEVPVVDDLERAAARLRAERAATVEEPEPPAEIAADLDVGEPPAEIAAGVDAAEPRAETVAGVDAAEPPAEIAAGVDAAEPPAETVASVAAASPPQADDPAAPFEAAAAPASASARGDAPALALAVLHAAAPSGPTTSRWLSEALVALCAHDAAAAERVLLAALAVQGARATKDVAYELELPVTGRHRVTVSRGGPVVVSALAPEEAGPAQFRLAGSAAALAPLAAGGASRRPEGVRVSGRKRRLRRLLRAQRPAVGLPELVAAGARIAPADLLALLCGRVPAGRVAGRALSVAYLVADPATAPSRVVVRAHRDAVAPAPDPTDEATVDATVTVESQQLLGVLAGTAPALVAGDQDAVITLHGWLRQVQGLPL